MEEEERRTRTERSRSPVGLNPSPSRTPGALDHGGTTDPFGPPAWAEGLPGESKPMNLRDPSCPGLGTAVWPQGVGVCRVYLPKGSGDVLFTPSPRPPPFANHLGSQRSLLPDPGLAPSRGPLKACVRSCSPHGFHVTRLKVKPLHSQAPGWPHLPFLPLLPCTALLTHLPAHADLWTRVLSLCSPQHRWQIPSLPCILSPSTPEYQPPEVRTFVCVQSLGPQHLHWTRSIGDPQKNIC